MRVNTDPAKVKCPGLSSPRQFSSSFWQVSPVLYAVYTGSTSQEFWRAHVAAIPAVTLSQIHQAIRSISGSDRQSAVMSEAVIAGMANPAAIHNAIELCSESANPEMLRRWVIRSQLIRRWRASK